MGVETNYFVCTLGEACSLPHSHRYSSVNDLLDQQSKNNHDVPAVGLYASRAEDQLEPRVQTFGQVHRGVVNAAALLKDEVNSVAGHTVGLLCSSSPEFLFTWLACISLGHAVLLIAPECSASGAAQLCRDREVSLLIVDGKHESLGRRIAEEEAHKCESKIRYIIEPFHGLSFFEAVTQEPQSVSQMATVDENDVAYLHHTSGTSSGKPKPIAQTHRGAVGVLPTLDGRATATFTTTPLYHGGPADIFRAWTSNAMIWLFSSKYLPVTAGNVIRCLDLAHQMEKKGLCPPIAYFTSVPYVLQMLAENDRGLTWLQRMQIVGVGGAALPQMVGDELVKKKVNLVSRFGSAECGFLLSSHRRYAEDQAWNYLRLEKTSTQLRFEKGKNGMAELVALVDWPHIAKRNRADGSYATSDLFIPHPEIINAWKYHSRADSQLTLITGKKFDPAPLEAALTASTPLLSDVLMFGNNKPYPGALLFRSQRAEKMRDEEFMRAVVPLVQKLNQESQAHAQISTTALVPMEFAECALEKSSKGTVLRGRADERYKPFIDDVYEDNDIDATACADEELPKEVKKIVQDHFSTDVRLNDEMDLFKLGLNSLMSIRIRHRLQRLLLPGSRPLPISVVEDCGSVKELAKHIGQARAARGTPEQTDDEQELAYMKEMAVHLSKFTPPTIGHGPVTCDDKVGKENEVIVLTGATGALGAHVLHQLRGNTAVSKIFCLVRGADAHAARERVNKALLRRQLPSLDCEKSGKQVVTLPAILRDLQLGLDDQIYSQVVEEATTIVHLAWSVNFRISLHRFVKDDLIGLVNLINLSQASTKSQAPRFLFCSSTASVIRHNERAIPESTLDDPASASEIGYSRSKWIAEQVCYEASKQPRLRGRVCVFRLGQVSGDTNTGVWNMSEAWPLMLSTVKITGTLPDIADQELDWLPVNVAANAVIEAALHDQARYELQVYNVLNNQSATTWRDALGWLEKKISFDRVGPEDWVQRLEQKASEGDTHPAVALIDHWKHIFNSKEDDVKTPVFETAKTKDALPALRDLQAVNESYFMKLWAWIDSAGDTNTSTQQASKIDGH